MKTSYIYCLFFCFTGISVQAQSYKVSDTCYYGGRFKRIKDISEAEYLRPPAIKDGSHYKVNFYYLPQRKLCFSGSYLAVEKDFKLLIDPPDAIKDGIFVFYDGIDRITAKGVYKSDKEVGEWNYYENGKLVEKRLFSEDEYYTTYYLPDGRKKEEGNNKYSKKYEKFLLEGEWIKYRKGERIAQRIHYTGGKRDGLTSAYDSLGNVVAEMNFSKGMRDGRCTTFYPYQKNRPYIEKTYVNNVLFGPYKEYDSHGKLTAEGEYRRGYKTGQWKYYKPGTDFIMTEINYVNDEGSFVTYLDSSTAVLVSGHCYEDRLIGEWVQYYPGTEKKHYVRHYSDGLLNGVQVCFDSLEYLSSKIEFVSGIKDGPETHYYPYSDDIFFQLENKNDTPQGVVKTFFRNGSVKRAIEFDKGKILDEHCFNEAGEVVQCPPFFQPARYHEDIMTYLGTNLRYPIDAKTLGIEGKAEIGFFVDDLGNVSDVNILKGFDKMCDEEARRLVMEMRGWHPAQIDGVSVTSYQKVSILFWIDKNQ